MPQFFHILFTLKRFPKIPCVLHLVDFGFTCCSKMTSTSNHFFDRLEKVIKYIKLTSKD